jgi:hypothetical protein
MYLPKKEESPKRAKKKVATDIQVDISDTPSENTKDGGSRLQNPLASLLSHWQKTDKRKKSSFVSSTGTRAVPSPNQSPRQMDISQGSGHNLNFKVEDHSSGLVPEEEF